MDAVDLYDSQNYSSHFWMFKYEGIIRLKIIDYKFNDRAHIGRGISQIIIENSIAVNYLSNFDYIVPVPINRGRFKERGYNQCDIIAQIICNEIAGIELKNNIIGKKENIQRQSGLSKLGRAQNVKHAFFVKNNINLEGKKIVIFDDIYTTGNTVNECARILRMLGCKEIGVFTIAKD